jgi:hypothetical protein
VDLVGENDRAFFWLVLSPALPKAVLWNARPLRKSIAQPDSSIYPTGVTCYDPGKAYNVLVLFSGSDDKTHLIDMEGNEVQRWDHRGFPSGILDPALVGGARGLVMVKLTDMTGSETGMIPGIPAIQEQDHR